MTFLLQLLSVGRFSANVANIPVVNTHQAPLSEFDETFEAATGNKPFPWQMAFFELLLSGEIRPQVCLPTGAGKTSIMAIWLLALAEQAKRGIAAINLPRRLIWVVNRRVVVDQATDDATRLRQRLGQEPGLERARQALMTLSSSHTSTSNVVGISTLRGQFADNAEWRGDPAKPAIIIGTVDMIGSRLLFSGYGIGYKTKPLHAAFLGQDALLVHDEAHLEPAFQQLIMAIKAEQERCREFRLFQAIALSATLRPTTRQPGEMPQTFGLTDEEIDAPESVPDPPTSPVHYLWRRQAAAKKMILAAVDDKTDDLVKKVVDCARGLNGRGAVIIFLRSVESVNKVVEALRSGKDGLQVVALTGTLRGLERDLLIDTPVFKRFLPPQTLSSESVYLVCTSAGEVGVNLSADHLVCDLSTFESMVQRFGRVNRFGDRADTEIHIFIHKKAILRPTMPSTQVVRGLSPCLGNFEARPAPKRWQG